MMHYYNKCCSRCINNSWWFWLDFISQTGFIFKYRLSLSDRSLQIWRIKSDPSSRSKSRSQWSSDVLYFVLCDGCDDESGGQLVRIEDESLVHMSSSSSSSCFLSSSRPLWELLVLLCHSRMVPAIWLRLLCTNIRVFEALVCVQMFVVESPWEQQSGARLFYSGEWRWRRSWQLPCLVVSVADEEEEEEVQMAPEAADLSEMLTHLESKCVVASHHWRYDVRGQRRWLTRRIRKYRAVILIHCCSWTCILRFLSDPVLSWPPYQCCWSGLLNWTL